MDVKVHMADGKEITVNNVVNIKAVPNVDNPGIATIIMYNEQETTHPVAAMYSAIGYELVNRR